MPAPQQIRLQPRQLAQLQQQLMPPVAAMPQFSPAQQQLIEAPLPNPNRPPMLMGIVPFFPFVVWFVALIMWVALSPSVWISVAGAALWLPVGMWLYGVLRKDPNALWIILLGFITYGLTINSPAALPLSRGRYSRGMHAS